MEGVLEISELTHMRIKFMVSGISLAIANGLRRIMISEVPTIAIDLVEIGENSTNLSDEFIAHRMGLIPLCSDGVVDVMLYARDCVCTGFCAACSVELNLDVKGITSETQLITTGNLNSKHKLVCPSIQRLTPDNSTPKPSDEIVIAKIRGNLGLTVRCIAKKGIGKEHSKWSPVCGVGFDYDRENFLRHTVYDTPADWPDDEPWKNIEEDEDNPRPVIDYTYKPNFYFDVESTGAMLPENIALKAVSIFIEKIRELDAAFHTYFDNPYSSSATEGVIPESVTTESVSTPKSFTIFTD
ncbi:DNA-directed RNA polymerase II subunit RPB3-like [Teleopsis dalmanni]|uniref:DNA-directed RNA polymerase II subunit RPB3-like n=1 Tax=Teleopsis dalmanni TaxID=139649 RepID=UPI0018CCF2F1|nr:DNA-directed RNA polymerase II subunit RPB3-like [Teleopsis dalmanni]XP_037952017.1 DNA-directed RNA polymerase II subunit RPB3-like [Teleopsis dalmanni]XP_037952019.1 DNA-directed RNA polymerase II subunit RPB3-like [Teleopsis dalmanni]